MARAAPLPLLSSAALVLALGCTDRPAFVVLTVEDPDNVAAAFAEVRVGLSREELAPVEVNLSAFPLSITVTARAAGGKAVWADARDAGGQTLGRGHVTATFATNGTPTATVVLAEACDADEDCGNAVYCDGAEMCVDGTCAAGSPPCGNNVTCVTSSCNELGGGAGSCSIVVHHSECGTGMYCNPLRGCVEGSGCLEDVDCRDLYVCNGDELCINLVCVGGAPPDMNDNDTCTLDGCDDSRAALGLEPIFHQPLLEANGNACTIPGGGSGVCVASRSGCVASTCGDGVVFPAAGEICDDGDLNDDDWAPARHCNSDCSGDAPFCGDGTVDAGHETCDDGDARDTANGCDAACQRYDDCGDGVVQTLFETCDDQNSEPCDGCRNDCQRGCRCAMPAACLTGNVCLLGLCTPCDQPGYCGPGCVACSGITSACSGADGACVCDPSAAPNGSCGAGMRCSNNSCIPCDETQHCGPTCAACGGATPVCAGSVNGCTTDCSTFPDFTPCSLVTVPDRAYDICSGGLCVSPGCGTRSCNTPGPGFAHADLVSGWQYPDTGLRACYNSTAVVSPCPGTPGDAGCATTDGCGQDGQYGWDLTHAASARFSRTEPVAGEPVVTDNVTDLVWQGCAAGRRGPSCTTGATSGYSWAAALTYCDQLSWGGQLDWRLPDVYELFTTVDASAFDPCIDLTVFPATVVGWSWSSTASSPGSAVAVNTSRFGVTAYGMTSNGSVRCVRAGAAAAAISTGARFNRTVPAAGEPVVADARTSLTWQGCAGGLTGAACDAGTVAAYTWSAALAHCEGLTWGGQADWRLPSRTEALSSVDLRGPDPAFDATAFPHTPAGHYWTSTSSAGDAGSAWEMGSDGGLEYSYWGAKSTAYFARCVRTTP